MSYTSSQLRKLPLKIALLFLLAATGTANPLSVRFAGEVGPRLSFSWAQATEQHVLSGQDQQSKPWRIALPNSYATAYALDLDRNGQEDLVVIHPIEGNKACATGGGDVTVILRDAHGRPAPWQSTMRLARNTRDEDLPFLITDRNGDGFAEIAVVECVGEVPTLAGIYEARPEGVVPLARRAYASYASDLKKLYRNKSLVIPAEDAPTPAANAAAATLDQVSTQQWGGSATPPQAKLNSGETLPGWPRLGPAQAGFERVYSTGDNVTDLLEVLARRFAVQADPSNLLRTYPSGSQTRVALRAGLVTGTAVERPIALVDAPVPASVRDSSFFVAPGQECFALYVGSGSVGAMHAAGCDAAASLRAKGLTAEPFVAHNSVVWQTNPAAREWRLFDAGDMTAGASTLILQPVGAGRLVGAARAGEFVLAQWRDAAASWLSLHRESGVALTDALPIAASDQLLAVDDEKGLLFLRWDQGKPAMWREVPARVEWRTGN